MKKNFWMWLLHSKKKEKNLTFMKIWLFAMLFLVVGTFSDVHAQTEKLTLKRQDASMLDIILAVEKQSKMTFVYSVDAVKQIGKISIDVKDVLIDSVMRVCLAKSDYTYTMEKNIIVIKKKAPVQGTKEQKRMISGTVMDKAKMTLPGVSVYIKGSTIGVVSDINGKYTIEVPQSTTTLVFSFVGMRTKDVPLKELNVVNVVMEEEMSDLDEVTVIAYGERNKRELISSVSSIKAKDLEEVPSASLENLLQGHMAGVEVNNISGSPGGGGSQVVIRGYNSLLQGSMTDGSPLYVIDGVPVSSFTSPITGTNTLAEIDPSTIESVEVLKDAASAALYGSRASNGVILITTKQGKTGRGKFSASVSQSYSILPKTPTQLIGHGERMAHVQMLRSARKAWGNDRNGWNMPTSYEEAYRTQGVYDYFWNAGVKVPDNLIEGDRILHDSLNPFFNNSTNWWKYSFQAGKILNANLQASGGTETIKYMIGAGWYDEKGIMLGSNFSRMNLISNLNIIPRQNLKLDARLYLAYTDRSKGAANTSFNGASPIEGLTVDPKSNSSLLPGGGVVEEETLKRLNETSEKNMSYRIRANLGLSYELIKGLNLSTTVAIDYSNSKKNAFTPSYLDITGENQNKSTGELGSATMFTNENMIRYNASFKERHNVELLAGLSYMRNAKDAFSASGRGGPSDKMTYVQDGYPFLKEFSGQVKHMQEYKSDFEESIMLSYYGRLAYNFDKKYLFEFTIREDGSSVFGEDVRWATFPSVAAGWAFSEESFMKDFWWLDYGKFRASWGKSGNVFKDPYLAHGTLGIGSKFMGNTGMIPTQMLASGLTWEESDQYDIGLDLDFLEYRLKLKLDYYYKYSSSLLQNVQLPGNVYYHTDALQNVLEISNQGLELEAVMDILRNTDVKWRARFNISRNWNRFEKSNTGMDLQNVVIGRPVQGVVAYRDLDYAQGGGDIPVYYDQMGNKNYLSAGGNGANPYLPGMRLIEDVNLDGRINRDDEMYISSALPIAHGGFASEVTWKGFDLNVLFSYSLGRHIMNMYALPPNYKSIRYKTAPIFMDFHGSTFWQQEGDVADYPTMQGAYGSYAGQFEGNYASNVEKVSHLRLKQLTLGYNVPSVWLRKVNIEGVRVFVTGENLFLLTNYSGLDPETVDPGRGGQDNFNNYPLARKFTLGLTVNF